MKKEYIIFTIQASFLAIFLLPHVYIFNPFLQLGMSVINSYLGFIFPLIYIFILGFSIVAKVKKNDNKTVLIVDVSVGAIMIFCSLFVFFSALKKVYINDNNSDYITVGFASIYGLTISMFYFYYLFSRESSNRLGRTSNNKVESDLRDPKLQHNTLNEQQNSEYNTTIINEKSKLQDDKLQLNPEIEQRKTEFKTANIKVEDKADIAQTDKIITVSSQSTYEDYVDMYMKKEISLEQLLEFKANKKSG